jgi:uncharacterized protein YprB with RNaseH-like and TPR domain/predicted nuclease with RNAse H fold
MIKNTFCFIPGIGPKTEKEFWKSGVFTWDDLERSFSSTKSKEVKRDIISNYISRAKDSLLKGDSSFFAKHLPNKEHWRLYKDFQDKTIFLDIETTGLSSYYDVITLIGTYNGSDVKLFIRDNNLSDINDYLSNYQIIVTFNGKIFDIPFVKKEFSKIEIPPIHIDLRFLAKSVGIPGSLKIVEKKLNITRDKSVEDMGGREAAVLWNRFVKGSEKALEELILYNIYDITNLEKIMRFCYSEKVKTEILKDTEKKVNQAELFKINWRNKFYHSFNPSKFKISKIKARKLGRTVEVKANRKLLLKIRRDKIKQVEIKINTLLRKIKQKHFKATAVGIDLSGSEKKASGFCFLNGKTADLDLLNTDRDIITHVEKINPAIISIDSPLNLPKGRDCPNDSCECRKYGITRECERILKKRGVNVYPCLIKSMQNLTMRGMKLAKYFTEHNFKVIESYPGAAQDILRFPRKRINLNELEVDLMNMGIKPVSNERIITHDEIDALTSALVGYFYLAEMYEAIGNIDEGYLIVPDVSRK